MRRRKSITQMCPPPDEDDMDDADFSEDEEPEHPLTTLRQRKRRPPETVRDGEETAKPC